jgi:hypothetical protein
MSPLKAQRDFTNVAISPKLVRLLMWNAGSVL